MNLVLLVYQLWTIIKCLLCADYCYVFPSVHQRDIYPDHALSQQTVEGCHRVYDW